MGFESVSLEHPFFYWFPGQNVLVDDENLKRGGDFNKREDQGGGGFFSFLSIKTYVTF